MHFFKLAKEHTHTNTTHKYTPGSPLYSRRQTVILIAAIWRKWWYTELKWAVSYICWRVRELVDRFQTFNSTLCFHTHTYSTAVLLAFVWGGHNSQILDDLLGVLCLPSTGLSTRVEKNGNGIRRSKAKIVKWNDEAQDDKQQWQALCSHFNNPV